MHQRILAVLLGFVMLSACDEAGDARDIPADTTPTVAAPANRKDVTACQYRMDALLPPQWQTGEPEKLRVAAYECPEEALIRLERVASRESNGRFLFEWITDITTAPLESDQVFVMLYCQLRGQDNTGIVAIATLEDEPELTGIRNAWLIDAATAEVADLLPREVKCGNEAYGV